MSGGRRRACDSSLPFAEQCGRRADCHRRLRLALRNAVPEMKQPARAHAAIPRQVIRAAPRGNKLTYPPPEVRTSSPRPDLFFVSASIDSDLLTPIACASPQPYSISTTAHCLRHRGMPNSDTPVAPSHRLANAPTVPEKPDPQS